MKEEVTPPVNKNRGGWNWFLSIISLRSTPVGQWPYWPIPYVLILHYRVHGHGDFEYVTLTRKKIYFRKICFELNIISQFFNLKWVGQKGIGQRYWPRPKLFWKLFYLFSQNDYFMERYRRVHPAQTFIWFLLYWSSMVNYFNIWAPAIYKNGSLISDMYIW